MGISGFERGNRGGGLQIWALGIEQVVREMRRGEREERREEGQGGSLSLSSGLVGTGPLQDFLLGFGMLSIQALASQIWFSTIPNNSMNKSTSFYVII